MYMVYWTVIDNGIKTPQSKEFDSADMISALNFMEALRAKQRAGEGIRFVTMCSENPDSVGHAGIAETGSDYKWKKRRR
jgi:hypothetical protein